MPIPPDSHASTPRARADLRLFAWACLGPTVWFLALVVLYALGERECQGWVPITSWSVFGVSVLAHALALAVLGRASSAQTPPSARATAREDGRSEQRVDFMRSGAIALNLLSLVVLSGFSFPLLMLRPCE
jgi:hypothetical protein